MATSSGTAYASLTDLHTELGIATSSTANDLSMQLALDVATIEITDYCGRSFLCSTGQTRYYTAECSSHLLTDDILAITALRTDADGDGTFETTHASTAYLLAPFNAAAELSAAPYTSILFPSYSSGSFPTGYVRGVQIVGTFGYSTAVPTLVKKAALFQAARSFRAKDAPFGTVGGQDFGANYAGQGNENAGALSLHPFARRMLDFYRRRVIA